MRFATDGGIFHPSMLVCFASNFEVGNVFKTVCFAVSLNVAKCNLGKVEMNRGWLPWLPPFP